MVSDNHHANHPSVEKSFRIKPDEKFFSRVMSKDNSMANSSSRVFYYGETSIAVPFVWEAQPGTPKHLLSETSLLPPLTPPPSYFSNSKSKNNRRTSSKANIFSCILPRFTGSRKKKTRDQSPLSSWSSSSSSSSSSWSLVYPSSSCSIGDRDQGSLSFSHSRIGVGGSNFLKDKGSSKGFRGCYPFGNMMKNAIVNHETETNL